MASSAGIYSSKPGRPIRIFTYQVIRTNALLHQYKNHTADALQQKNGAGRSKSSLICVTEPHKLPEEAAVIVRNLLNQSCRPVPRATVIRTCHARQELLAS